MDARFYGSEEIDIERLSRDLVNVYQAQGYQAQQMGTRDQQLIQIKKGGDFEAIIGMQAVLSLTIQRTGGGVLAMIGQQRWIDKAAVGVVGVAIPLLWPLALTAGMGALRQASLGNQVLNMLDGLIRQQSPNIQIGPVPQQYMPHVQQQWAPPPAQTPYYTPPPPVNVGQPGPMPPVSPMPVPPQAVGKPRCPNCNTPHEPGDTFCSGCGRSLAPARLYCSNCNYELKPGASFCPKCGSSTFATTSAASQQSAPKPPPQPAQPTVTYTPPAQPTTPVYTPPTPPTPVYTPPPAPPAPVYKPSTIEPYAAPTVANTTPPTPPKPEVPYYVPPVTQTPSVVPQPQVTVTPATPKKEPPAPPKPEVPYYVPPVTQTPSVVPQPKVTFTPATPKEVPPPPKREKVYYTPPAQAQSAPAQPPQSAPADLGQAATIPAQTPAAPVADPANPPTTIQAQLASQPAPSPAVAWGVLSFSNNVEIELKGESAMVGRIDHDLGNTIDPDVDLSKMQGADTVSRIHAVLEHIGSTYTLTDLNSTNATRINNKRLDPDKATPINDGDTLQFGKVTCTFKKL